MRREHSRALSQVEIVNVLVDSLLTATILAALTSEGAGTTYLRPFAAHVQFDRLCDATESGGSGPHDAMLYDMFPFCQTLGEPPPLNRNHVSWKNLLHAFP